MDVRCERCRAQYVFDDDQVTEAGLAVQCSNCGHVFRVKRKALVVTVPVRPGEAAEAHPIVPSPVGRTATAPAIPAPETTPIPDKKEWRVRQANGNVFTFKELTTLQKWIVERKVNRDDEISLSGDQWKRLGNIAELATFFQVVEAAERGAMPAAITPLPMAAVLPPPPYPPGGYGPPAYPPQTGFAAPIPLQGGMPPAGGPVTQVNVSLPPNPTAAWEGQRAQPRAVAPEPAWTREPHTRLDELEEAELRAVKGGGGKWILLLVLLLAGAAVAVYLVKPEILGLAKAPPPPPPAPVVEAKKEPPPPPPAPPRVEPPPPPAEAQAPRVETPPPAPATAAEPPAKPAPRKAATATSLIAEAKRLRDRGKSEQALDLYGRAVEMDADNADAMAGRGWCYLDMSQYAPAEASFQAALESVAGHADALMGLAETYRYQGRKADAVKYYEKYLALHPEGDDAVAARNAISQLKE